MNFVSFVMFNMCSYAVIHSISVIKDLSRLVKPFLHFNVMLAKKTLVNAIKLKFIWRSVYRNIKGKFQ